MKVLLIVHQFLPDYCGGTEILTFSTCRELQKQGHQVHVFSGAPAARSMDDSQRFDRYIFRDIPVERFHHASVPMGDQANVVEAEYNNHFLAQYFQRYLQNLAPDIVHFFHSSRLSASAVDVCHNLRIPAVFTPTDFWFICPTMQLRLLDDSPCSGPGVNAVNCLRHLVYLRRSRPISAALSILPDWSVRQIIRTSRTLGGESWFGAHIKALSHRAGFLKERINKFQKVIAPTHFMAELLKNHGLSSQKILYSSFGIELEYLRPSGPKGTKKNLRLGFIGTIYHHKGVHVLIRAVQSLCAAVNVRLDLYGKENEFPEYSAQLKRIAGQDSRIVFRGTFPNERIGDIFSVLDVLVVPSLWTENSPLVIYSAQAAGCPVIASNVPGISEVIQHENNGLLFNPGDVTSLADSIQRLAMDRELLRKLAGNAKQPKSIMKYTEELLNIYREIIQEEPKGI